MADSGSGLFGRALTAARSRALRRTLAVLFVCSLGFAAEAQAATYTVGVTSDGTGTCSVPSSGKCSLRQLITYENLLTSIPNPTDTIVLPAGSYNLTNGALGITESVNITGAGARTTHIYQETTTGTNRVFDIMGNAKVNANPTVAISGVDMVFGKADSSNGFFGGDVRNQANLTLSEDFIEDGSTTAGSGGGISNDGGTLTLTHSLVWNNSGGNDSGAIQNYGDDTVGAATLNVDNSTIADNSSALGGGIFSWCAGAKNECSTSGATNTTTITNSTIALNNGGSRGTTGGGLLVSQGTISVENSIVASNTVTDPLNGGQVASNCGSSSPGVITSLGDNLETAADCGFKAAGDLQNTSPGFLTGGLAYNGGNTETFALSGTSPAVDAAAATAAGCSGTDQRDVTRPQGTGCDIGAYELFQPVEGQQFTADLGRIGGTAATIDWGDGTATTAGTVDSLGEVTGTHTYADEGVYHGKISWKNSDGTSQQTAFDLKVCDAPLTAKPVSIGPAATVSFSGPVATFTDANPGATVSDFSAIIAWGDGTRSSGTIATNPGGGFVVNGTHTYSSTGGFKFTVTITDVGGAAGQANGAATVKPPPPAVTSLSPTAGPTSGGTSVTITGTNFTNATAVNFGATTATSFTVNSDTQITAFSPAQSAAIVHVTVTTPSGTSATSSADQFTYQAPPTATITSPPPSQTYALNQVVATAFSCTEGTNGPGIQSCTDSGGATNGTGTLNTANIGAHTYTVTAVSKDGQGATKSVNYTVIGPPTATISAPANNGTYNLNQNVSTTFSCAESINGPGIQTCTDANGASGGSGTLDTTTAGAHTYTVTATSKDGQTATATINYTVIGPPTATITAPANNQTYSLNAVVATTFSCAEATGGPGIQTCTDSNNATGGTGALNTTTTGAHTYTVTATSKDGQTGTKSISYTVAAAPTAAVSSPANNQTYNLNAVVATAFSCTEGASGPGIQSCVDSNGASSPAGALNTSTTGAHTYTVTATSKDGQTGTATINYTVVGPPTATITTPANNQTYNLNAVVATAFSCSEATGGPGIQTCADSNNVTGGTGALNTSTAGAHTYTVTATSKDGQTATATINYTVSGPPTAAISAPANNQTYNLNQTVSTTFSCTEGSSGPGIQTCADSNGASGTTGTLHGALDTTTPGAHTYTVTATSKDGQTGTKSISYTVAAPPTASIISPANNQKYNLNQVVATAFTCTEGASGPGIQTCADSNGASNGTGSLNTSTIGAHTYTVTATSQDGQTGTASISYTVIGPPTATISTPADNQTYNLGQAVSTTFSCAEATGGPGIQTCKDSGGATGGAGTIDTSTGGVHAYTVTATSTDGQTGTATIHYTVIGGPTATISSPANNGTYNLNQNVSTTFSCADASGGPGIQTCTDSNNATGGTGALNTGTAGAHTYTVTATSKDGQSGTATISYTVIGPPTAAISTPANNQTYNLGAVVATAFSCTEATGGPGIQSCTDSNNVTGGIGALNTATTGAHSYTVTATSKDGQSGTATINYTVLGPPTATISAPANNGTYNLNQNVATTFSCADATGAPGIQTCTDSNNATGGTGALNTATAGAHSYTVTATSKDGQTATKTINYTVLGPPTATITTPANNQAYNLNQTVSTTFSCAEANGGPGIQTCADSNGSTNGTGALNTSTPGAHTYTVTATSKDGQTASKTINYTIAGPPTAQINAPADNQTYNLNQAVPTAFSCTDDGNGPGIQSCADSNGSTGGTGALDTSTPGAHSYTVTATSKDGLTRSTTIHYTVIGLPTATITSPADNQSYAFGQPVATAFSCTDDANGPGIQTCADSNGASNGAGTLDTSTAGAHTYTVTATSKDGQSATATIHYTVASPAAPTVSGGAPNTQTTGGATPSGTVNPEGTPTQAFFQYGLDLSQRGPGASNVLYDQSTPVQPVGSDQNIHFVSAALTGLLPGALYHVRLVAINSAGTTFGQDQTFTTAQAPPPPPPVVGQDENATPVSGKVFIKGPNGQFIPLTGATQIPNGSVVDATGGSLEITAAVGKGKTEHGTFGGAIFQLTQSHGGLTTLHLLENAFKGAPSYAICKKHKSADATAAALSSKTLQLLKANAHGKFSTSGKYSAATVRGTRWTIADRCDGTLTHVITDSVAVNDFVRHTTVILHAGQSYLARAPH